MLEAKKPAPLADPVWQHPEAWLSGIFRGSQDFGFPMMFQDRMERMESMCYIWNPEHQWKWPMAITINPSFVKFEPSSKTNKSFPTQALLQHMEIQRKIVMEHHRFRYCLDIKITFLWWPTWTDPKNGEKYMKIRKVSSKKKGIRWLPSGKLT